MYLIAEVFQDIYHSNKEILVFTEMLPCLVPSRPQIMRIRTNAHHSKGPFRTKNTLTIAKIVNYYAVVFLLRPLLFTTLRTLLREQECL